MFLLRDFEGEIVYNFASWSMLTFIGAADCKISSLLPAWLNTLVVAVVMILCMWVMYNQLRLILGMLLVFHAVSLTLCLVDRVIFSKNVGMSNIILYYA